MIMLVTNKLPRKVKFALLFFVSMAKIDLL